MKKGDALLLLVNAAGDRPLSPQQIQKLAFLMGQSGISRLPDPFFEFRPAGYGPLSEEIPQEANRLAGEKLVFRVLPDGTQAASQNQPQWHEWAITPSGARRAEEIRWKELSLQEAEYLQELVRWGQSLSLRDLTVSVINAHPRMGRNALFNNPGTAC